ncbi:serine hydrolase [Undibacterium sp. Di27W]|uniref:serine hydrolase n=1 Tax=Undibacterium sp. Di27W TaxID=3413036 RepID=UPI003BF523B4
MSLLQPVLAADEVAARVDKIAQARVSSGAIPGLVLARITGQEQTVQGYGLVSNGKTAAHLPDASTVFEIGSVSKTFTALLLADMQVRGQLKLDDTVASLLPGYEIPQYQGRAISLLDLATQTSGLPRLPANLMPRQVDNPYADYSENNLRDFLRSYQLTRAPGSKYEYSNLGFGLLGHALSVRAGKLYSELLQERITTPLGMPDTGISLTTAMQARLATSHDGKGKSVANWDFTTLVGAGAVRSNAQDMLRYVRAHMQGATLSTPAGLQLVQQPQRPTGMPGLQIGLAWHVQAVRGQTLVWHNGMTGGYASFVGFSADGQRGVVVLANASVNVDDIGMTALLPAAPETEVSQAGQASEARLSAQAMLEYVGRYQLAPGVSLNISAGPEGLLAQVTGQSQAPVFQRRKDEFFYKIVDASLHFERDAQGKIQSLSLHQDGRVMPAPRMSATVPEPVQRVAIQMPAEQLQAYTGSYTLAPGFKLQVTVEAGQLYVQATAQGRNPVFAQARDEFFYKGLDAQLSFQRQPDGKVKGVILHQSGRDLPGPRDAD